MNPTEKYYQKWINNIAKTTSPIQIKGHLTHHIKDLKNPKKNNPTMLGCQYV